MRDTMKVFKHLSDVLSTFSNKKLKALITKFKIPVTDNIIDSIDSYVRTTGKYKPILTEYLGLDASKYLDCKRKIFTNHPEKRKIIKNLFDSYNMRFRKNTLEPKEEKQIITETNLNALYKPLKIKNKIKREVKLKKLFEPNYKIIESQGKYIKKYKTYVKVFNVEGHHILPDQYLTIIKKMFDRAINNIEGKVNIVITNYKLTNPVNSGIISTKESYENYIDKLSNQFEYHELDITETTFEFTVIELPRGGKFLSILSDEDIDKKRSICRIKNNDNICLARSIVTALSIQSPDYLANKLNHSKLTNNDLKYIKQGRMLQKTLAVKLHNLCNIPLEICSLEEVKIFEEFLDNNIL